MYLVAIAWMYVVLMMTAAEVMAPNGTVLGAVFTFLLYGALPLSIVLYLMGTPVRRKARSTAEAAEMAEATETSEIALSTAEPDGSRHAAGGAVPPERKEA